VPNAQNTSAANVRDCGKDAEMSNQNNGGNSKTIKTKITILYERLSVEDDRDTESQSIENQRTMLQDYAERNGMMPYVHIADDGYSGTNWQRPGWNEVITKIESGQVANLLVKDSSRIGRDFLRVGLYRELCHEKGVRLICINDGIDTAKGDDDFTPFRDLMSEWYARDISKKIKSVFQSKGRNGQPISSKAPYGFYKNPVDKNNWLVDEYAAGIVRRIFKLTLDGNGPYQIARILHDDKIEKPSYYLARVGYVNKPSALDAPYPYGWSAFTVSTIIASMSYLGHLVNFKYEKPSFKSKKFVERPKEDWLIFENHHEAIVDQETWELAQKMRETKRRHDTIGEANPLTGLVFCIDCGSKMYNHRGKNHKSHYCCGDYKNKKYYFADKHCSQHYVTDEALRSLLLDTIKRTTSFVRDYEDEFIQMVYETSAIQQGETVKAHSKKIAKSTRRIDELDKMFHSLYEDKVKGVISEERFIQMSKSCEQEQAELQKQVASMQSEVDAFNIESVKADSFVALVHKYTRIDSIEDLTAAVMYEFVERIEVHEAIWSEATEEQKRKGTRSQQIDIYLKYIGDFSVPDMRTAEQIEADAKE